MCGIAGWIGTYPETAAGVFLHNLAHRGPDASGSWASDQVLLCHTRLAILDLSEAANQPFHSACRRFVMVYNGEVYNYRELALQYALPLKTGSDTEVILELFARLGPEMVSRLNGMFAFAIWDMEAKELHLFRDRLGIKPLYTREGPEGFLFASELPAHTGQGLSHTLNQDALALFLHRGYIPEPHTFWNEYRKFPAGTRAVVKDGKVQYHSYWRAEDHIAAHTLSHEAGAIARVHELLRDSVRLRLVADVPFGTFLSGGADSGLITAIAAELHDQPLDTFNVSFEDAAFDETAFARQMAAIVKANHHNFTVTRTEVMERLDRGLKAVGEPFADSSIFPTMAVSSFAARHVKMALSGDGGDELFMGYGAYTWAERMAKPRNWHLRKAIAAALRIKSDSRSRRAAHVFNAPNKEGLAAHIFSQEQNFFTQQEIEAITGRAFTDPWRLPLGLPRLLTPAEQQAFFDLTNYLKDDLLVKVDRASMRFGLEVRVPFLDHRMVEQALNIDPVLKSKGGEPKYIIKKIMERYYPPRLIYRKKWGFSIPLEKWMKKDGALTPLKPREEGLTRAWKSVEKVYTAKNDAYLYNRLYALGCISGYL